VSLEVERVLGRLDGGPAAAGGPTLLLIGGVHGNEPAGVLALERVLSRLAGRPRVRESLRGCLVAVSGNRAALRVGRRFVDRDLNRAWTAERIAELTAGPPTRAREVEDVEQLELLAVFDQVFRDAQGPVLVMDLHTTSGAGGAFVTVADTLPNRAFAMGIPAPLILGLEELVEGTLLSYLAGRSRVALGFEGGQHGEPEAVDRIEAAVWVVVARSGLLPESGLAEVGPARRRLARDARPLPRVVEMRRRHEVRPGDRFRMRPGYRNFRPVSRGEVLAVDRTGEVRAPESGRLLMPLYQDQGDDGFFVVREIRPFWLHVSLLLRRLRVGRFVHWLPGIRRHPEREDALVVDPRVARLRVLDLLLLLGFRRRTEEDGRLIVTRRRFEP